MINKLNTVGLTIEVNTAILFAKRVGSIKPRIAVRGAVVMVTVGTVKVSGAFALLSIGSTRSGEETGIGKGCIGKNLPGYIGFKKKGSIDHGGNGDKNGACWNVQKGLNPKYCAFADIGHKHTETKSKKIINDIIKNGLIYSSPPLK